jgi:hypothetical protein
MRINPVQPCPSLPLVPEKSGQFEDLKVPRGRWPCVLEHVGYLAGRHPDVRAQRGVKSRINARPDPDQCVRRGRAK